MILGGVGVFCVTYSVSLDNSSKIVEKSNKLGLSKAKLSTAGAEFCKVMLH